MLIIHVTSSNIGSVSTFSYSQGHDTTTHHVKHIYVAATLDLIKNILKVFSATIFHIFTKFVTVHL